MTLSVDMRAHQELSSSFLSHLIRSGEITIAGNKKLKIYGNLRCASGKRMKRENRVFFKDESEAKKYGYRPCGNCLKEKYGKWLKTKSYFSNSR